MRRRAGFEELSEQLIEAAPAIVLVLNESGQIVRVNPYFEQLTGFTLEEVRGRDWMTTLIPEYVRADISSVFRETLSGKATSGTINPILTRAGAELQVEWHNRVLTSPTGAVLAVLALGLDVTARIAAEQRLRKREAELERSRVQLNEAQRLARLGSWDLDLLGGTLSWSDEIFRIFELDKAAFNPSYEAFLQSIHPDDRGRVDAAYRGSLETRTPYEVVHRLRMADGRIKWVHERCETTYDEQERALHSLGTVQDVTAQREAEERFRALFQQAGVGVAEVDSATGRFLRVNSKCSEILGYSAQELLALDVGTVTHPDDRVHNREEMRRLCANEVPELSFEKRCIRKGGDVVWVNLTLTPLWKPGEPPSQCIAVAQDITARIDALQTQQRLEDQLRQSQKMEAIGTLAGGVAHDFNNLLMAIVGNLELARSLLPSGAPVEPHLTAIALAADRARDLVRQILAFSRKQPPRRAAVELASLVQEAGALLRATIPAGIELRLQTPADAPNVLGDTSQLHQVLMNLGTNGWHAVDPSGGKITIAVGSTQLDADAAARLGIRLGDYAKITVNDNGRGMDRVTLERIFEPFFTTKEAGKGSGLGLSVAHGIVKEHGGAIEVESTLGVGTTFSVLIPSLPKTANDDSKDPREHKTDFSERVLFLDDQPSVAEVARGLLERVGCSADAFTDSAAAIAAIDADPKRYTLLLTDHNMPGSSGIAVAREVRKRAPNIQIVLVSGFENYLERDLVQAGIDDRLQKPFGLRELRECLKRAGDRRSRARLGS